MFFPVPIEAIDTPLTRENRVHLFMLRLDQLHAEISGNKWFKLRYNLVEAKQQKAHTLLTFGGAYSNHIAAVAALGKEEGWHTIGIIRGEEHIPPNFTLERAVANGMQLHYVSRELYRDKEKLLETLHKFLDLKRTYIIPEGGANHLGVKGCAEIVKYIPIDFDYIVCACGTGTTLAGICTALLPHQQAIGISALKGGDFLKKEVAKWTGGLNNFQIDTEHHEGGYAKMSSQLLAVMNEFQQQHNIPLDRVYTGKMMLAIADLLNKKMFKPGSTLIAVHTGGLQGNGRSAMC